MKDFDMCEKSVMFSPVDAIAAADNIMLFTRFELENITEFSMIIFRAFSASF